LSPSHTPCRPSERHTTWHFDLGLFSGKARFKDVATQKGSGSAKKNLGVLTDAIKNQEESGIKANN
jgi:hypothetical protein